jgi:hypothetical protein
MGHTTQERPRSNAFPISFRFLRHHVAFGVVAPFGQGSGLQELYDSSAKQLTDLGHWSKREYRKNAELLDEAIATIG